MGSNKLRWELTAVGVAVVLNLVLLTIAIVVRDDDDDRSSRTNPPPVVTTPPPTGTYAPPPPPPPSRPPVERRVGQSAVDDDVTFVNGTTGPIDPFCGSTNAVLVDEDGRENEPVRGLYEIAGNNAVCSNKTPPGERASAILAFEIDGDDRPSHVDLWNGQFRPDFNGKATRVRFRP